MNCLLRAGLIAYKKPLYQVLDLIPVSSHRNEHLFGGVLAKIMVDTLKSAVLKRTLGEVPVFNPRFLNFARHYGFNIANCGVRVVYVFR